MIKKIFILVATTIVLALACKKEEICTDRGSYEINEFSLSINSKNIGLHPGEGENTETTIGSTRNQLMFTPTKIFKLAEVKKTIGFDIISTAYAKNCVEVENSLTNFDPNKTQLSINRDLDLSMYGLNGVILAGNNLLAEQSLRNSILKDIITNQYLHAGMDIPFTLSVDFLKPLNNQSFRVTLTMTTLQGIMMSSSTDVVVDVNA